MRFSSFGTSEEEEEEDRFCQWRKIATDLSLLGPYVGSFRVFMSPFYHFTNLGTFMVSFTYLQRFIVMMCWDKLINLNKSLITFGKKKKKKRVFEHRKSSLQRTLQSLNIEKGEKYLGLPNQFGGKKKDMLQYIMDRVQ